MKISTYLMVFSLALRKTLAYRVDFWVRFGVSVLTRLIVAYFLWTAILEASGQDALQGYTLKALLLYYSCIGVLSFVIRGADMGHISMEIFDGSLTKYLVYPVSYWRFKFSEYLALSVLYFFQLILVLGALALIVGLPPEVPLNASGVLMMVVSGLLGAYLYFALGACLQFVAFYWRYPWGSTYSSRIFPNMVS
jgi:ABC-2 type transport system permease protein